MARAESVHLDEIQRAEYVDGRMEGAALAEAERHLQQCSACSDAVQGDQEVAALLRRLPLSQPPRAFVLPQPLPRSRWSRSAGWLRYVSGLAAVFLVVVLAADLLATPAPPREEAISLAAKPANAVPAAAPALPAQAETYSSAAPTEQADGAEPAAAGADMRQAASAQASAPSADANGAAELSRDLAAATRSPAEAQTGAPGPLVRPWHGLLAALVVALAGAAVLLDRRARRP